MAKSVFALTLDSVKSHPLVDITEISVVLLNTEIAHETRHRASLKCCDVTASCMQSDLQLFNMVLL